MMSEEALEKTDKWMHSHQASQKGWNNNNNAVFKGRRVALCLQLLHKRFIVKGLGIGIGLG
jgi:hypothetical protein